MKTKADLKTITTDIRVSGKEKIIYTNLWNKSQTIINALNFWCINNGYTLKDRGNLSKMDTMLSKWD
jgi:hypothetical protein